MLRFIAALVLALYANPVAAFPLHGGGATITGDALTIMLSGMSVGQVKRVSGAVGNVTTAALAQTRANFDGYGTGTFGTFSEGMALGSCDATDRFSFSKGGYDPTHEILLANGGGHDACQDASIFRFDLEEAAAAINSSSHGVWTIAAASSKLIPISDPQPAGSIQSGPLFNSATATGSSGASTITLSSVTSGCSARPTSFCSGPYISVTGSSPSIIPAGTTISSVSGLTVTLGQPLQGNLSAVVQTIASGGDAASQADFWTVASITGQVTPVACHTYNTPNVVPTTQLWLTGGGFCGFSNSGKPGGFVYDDTQPDGSNLTATTSGLGGIGNKGWWDEDPVNACDLDTGPHLYFWDPNSAQLARSITPYGAAANFTVLATGLSHNPQAFGTGTIFPDPVNGSTTRAFFAPDGTTSTGSIILDMCRASGSPAYTNTQVTYTNSPSSFLPGFTDQEQESVGYNPDQGKVFIYDHANVGQVVLLAINSSLQGTFSNEFTLTGDTVSDVGLFGAWYDATHHCYILLGAGDVYVVKAQ